MPKSSQKVDNRQLPTNVDRQAELERELAEKDVLISLNSTITSIQDKRDILQLLLPKLKQLFNTDDIFICKLDTAKDTLNPILRVGDKQRYQHPEYEATVNSNFPIHDGFIDTILGSNVPLIFSVDEVNNWPSPPKYMAIAKATGLAESISTRLHNGDEINGILTIWADKRNSFSLHHIKLIQSIADQISIIVTNIHSSEIIKQREKENEILLLLSNEIAAIRNKADLVKILSYSLKKYIHYNDCTITIYNRDKKVQYVYAYHVEKIRIDHPEFKAVLIAEYPLEDNDLSLPHSPVVIDLDTLVGTQNDWAAFISKAGLKEFASIKLVSGDKLLGLFVLLSERKNSFTPETLSIIQKISYQISIAVAKLLGHEEIERREAEKSLLLSISNDMALIRDKEDMAKLINKKLKKLFFIQDFTIVSLQENDMTFGAYLFDEEDTPYKKKREYVQTLFNNFRFEAGLYNVVLESGSPVVFNIDEIMTHEVIPGHIRFFNSIGIKEIVGTALRIGNENIGILWIQPEQVNCFDQINQNVFKGVCSQISIALANIIANEEIKQKEKEKAKLLALSNDIASIRDKVDLGKVLYERLNEFFYFDDIVICTVNNENNTHNAFIHLFENGKEQSNFDSIITDEFDIADGIFDKVLESNEAIVFDLDELIKKKNTPPYIEFDYNNGMREMIAIALRKGKENCAALFILLKEKQTLKPSHINIIKGISYQLSIAVANILANEDIKKREQEKSILLSLSNEIAGVRHKNDLFCVVDAKLKELFSVDGFGIGLISEDRKTHSAYIVEVDDKIKNHADFKAAVAEKYVVEDGIFNRIINTDSPVEIKIAGLPDEPAIPKYASLWKKTGVEKIVGMSLRVGENILGCIYLQIKSETKSILRNNLVKGVCAQISIALSNILANEKIAKQLEEISHYKSKLEEENLYLQKEIGTIYNYGEIIGAGVEMQKVYHLLSQVSFTNSTVLITGETGTGKELIARAIHNASPRKARLMVKVNCAAIPINLIESELFGHEKGAFTGATERRIGKFELANKSTLFLDEIGEMPLELQVKFLRALQEREIERVGGSSTIKIDVRIVAATNRNLQKEVDEGRFRSDLFYRLNVFPLSLPPLRERKDDIPELAYHFMNRYSKNAGKKINSISPGIMREMTSYPWPGNIRELEHFIERSVLLTEGNTIKEMPLPSIGYKGQKSNLKNQLVKTIKENERDHILEVLKRCDGKIFGKGGAAALLGIPVSTLNSKIAKLGIKKEQAFE